MEEKNQAEELPVVDAVVTTGEGDDSDDIAMADDCALELEAADVEETAAKLCCFGIVSQDAPVC